MIRFTLLALVLASTAEAAPKPSFKLAINPVSVVKNGAIVPVKIIPLTIILPNRPGTQPPFIDEDDYLMGDFVPVPKGPAPVLPGTAAAKLPEVVKIPVAQLQHLDTKLRSVFDNSSVLRELDPVLAD